MNFLKNTYQTKMQKIGNFWHGFCIAYWKQLKSDKMNKARLIGLSTKAEMMHEELHKVREQVVKAIVDFLALHNGGITIICDKEKGSWVGIEAVENGTFYVQFDNGNKVFEEKELGDENIFDLNDFIINYYNED